MFYIDKDFLIIILALFFHRGRDKFSHALHPPHGTMFQSVNESPPMKANESKDCRSENRGESRLQDPPYRIAWGSLDWSEWP